MRHSFRAMGCEVVVAGATLTELDAVVRLFEERDRCFSRFRDDSELSRVNRSRARVLMVSPEFAAMLHLALEAARETDDLVDPTVGAAILALGYDRDFDLVDDGAAVQSVPASGFRRVKLYGRIVERPPGVELDLNGVVKGRTADDALALLAGPGFVSAGGDLAARGPIDVALPGGSAVRLERGALATSGTLTRSWTRGGERVHHLIDPATGMPADSPWLCVTVAGSTCLAADVAAKAAFLLGEDGPEWLAAQSLPGRFLGEDGVVLETPAWARQAAGEQKAA